MTAQQPTCTYLRIRSIADAHKLFHAVSRGKAPMVVRRLDGDERKMIKSGDVHVWEERGPGTEATGLGIERWTDGRLWGPSRVRDCFLFYHEKDRDVEDYATGGYARMLRTPQEDSDPLYLIDKHMDGTGKPYQYVMDVSPNMQEEASRERLVKQTYSVLVHFPARSNDTVRKWHMTAYFSTAQHAQEKLRTVDEVPEFRDVEDPPPGMYEPARAGRGAGGSGRARSGSNASSSKTVQTPPVPASMQHPHSHSHLSHHPPPPHMQAHMQLQAQTGHPHPIPPGSVPSTPGASYSSKSRLNLSVQLPPTPPTTFPHSLSLSAVSEHHHHRRDEYMSSPRYQTGQRYESMPTSLSSRSSGTDGGRYTLDNLHRALPPLRTPSSMGTPHFSRTDIHSHSASTDSDSYSLSFSHPPSSRGTSSAERSRSSSISSIATPQSSTHPSVPSLSMSSSTTVTPGAYSNSKGLGVGTPSLVPISFLENMKMHSAEPAAWSNARRAVDEEAIRHLKF